MPQSIVMATVVISLSKIRCSETKRTQMKNNIFISILIILKV